MGRRRPPFAVANKSSRDQSDAELLATVIVARGSKAAAHDTALQLIRCFGSLRALLQADRKAILDCSGIGRARLAVLRALPELARRYYAQSLPHGAPIRNPADTEAFLQAHMRHLEHELFCCLYLDNRHRVLGFGELFRGTIDGTSVYPREVVKEALKMNAAAVILAHNHPSGVAEPSQADEQITLRLKSALDLVDIRLLDHLIIGDGKAASLAGRGLI
ncbi:MAG: DNA repair protein RadC [Xanthomonadales bacterium]|nr:DNA repair protein RadC [Xanthomonadales bacterium]